MRSVGRWVLVCLWATALTAQNAGSRGVIGGVVTDPSGAAIPKASVRLTPTGGAPELSATTDDSGSFRFNNAGTPPFILTVEREGFEAGLTKIQANDRSASALRIVLRLAGVKQEVTIRETVGEVSTDSSENLDVVTLDRALLDRLPIFDQNYVAAMSQFLDPGSIATGGVTLVVNGMEQRNIGVSASAIQQVKINQNPYSAEFSRPGRGRVEILTKPGSSEYHGAGNFIFRDYHLNGRDAFASARAAEQRRIFEGSILGPLGKSHRNTFMISADREEQDLEVLVYAFTPSGILRQNLPAPQRDTFLSAGITHFFSTGHTGLLRGSYRDSGTVNRGAGGFVLPEAAANTSDREDELTYNDNLTVSAHLLNQFRIMFGRQHTPTVSVTSGPAIVVAGSFVGGGAQADRLQTENHIALNEILSWQKGKHQIRTGINVPDISRRGLDDFTNFGGTYTFSTLADYQAQRPFSYVRQQGDGHVVFLETIVGGFFQDDYLLRPNLTLSAGIRYDWQNFFHDNNNFSPRLSFAWAPGKSRRFVFRGGAGFFYDRSGAGPIFDLERYNGIRLRQVVLTDPSYPDPGNIGIQPTAITRLDPHIRLPYLVQFSAGVERQLSKSTTLAATYWATRGVSLFRSRDVNAPPPPNYLVRPNPGIGVYRQIEASGHLQSDSLEITFRGNLTRYFSGMAQYTLGRAYNDVPGTYSGSTRSTGINAFPANNYDLSGEWARADYDQRHRFNLLGTTHAARYLDFGVSLSANTGAPYSITTGRDDFRTGYANARPPGVPRNSLEGGGSIDLNLRWFHEFLLKGKKEGPRFTTAIDAFNVPNLVNYSSYTGNLSSPFFGQPVSSKPARRVQATLRFEF